MVSDYIAAYRRYCWPFESLADYRLAPFHLLASEGVVHSDKDHRLAYADAGTALRDHRAVHRNCARRRSMTDRSARRRASSGGRNCTGAGRRHGGQAADVCDSARGLIQPAIKCRGREYLRIIYGPDYTAPEHLARLRVRSLGQTRPGDARVRPRPRGADPLRPRASRCAASTSAPSASWRWRASRWTPGCESGNH
jgi:protein phosphatase